jgi:hypothetical protein
MEKTMIRTWKAAAAAFAFSALLGGAAAAQPYDGNPPAADYGPGNANDGNAYDNGGAANDDNQPYGYDSGYCDDYGCPNDYYDLPIYYGPVYYDDFWYDGPLYYRDWGGRQQYWIHGGWHYDQWQGQRPAQYSVGRYGPALGQGWYRSHLSDARVNIRYGMHGGGFAARAQGASQSFADRGHGGFDHHNSGGMSAAHAAQPQAPANRGGGGWHGGGGHGHGR